MKPDPQLTERLKLCAQRHGFQLAGVCPAVTPQGFHRFIEWLELGYGGQMSYLSDRREAYRHPRSVLKGVTTMVMLGMAYTASPPSSSGRNSTAQSSTAQSSTAQSSTAQSSTAKNSTPQGTGRVASYAFGELDYHDLIHGRLKSMQREILNWCPAARLRGVVDTAPLLEREFAQLAGLGWVGKNTLLLNKSMGSYFFIAALLTDLPLVCDPPFEAQHCGTCRACLDACPTDAFPEPFVLDARRCISYHTIESRDALPVDLRGKWNDWVFGCDVCQQVCPWNRHAVDTTEPELEPRSDLDPLNLSELFFLSDEAFRDRFRKTPLWRAKRRGILRNAAMVLGAQRDAAARDALCIGAGDEDQVIREACRWALKQIDS